MSTGAPTTDPADQATHLRALMDSLATAGQPRPSGPAPLKPATLGGRLGVHGWGRPAGANSPTGRAPAPARTRARVVAVASGKGGVGKTNLSVNLSAVLASRGHRVTLLDADFGLANADVVAGVSPRGRLDEVIEEGRPIRDILVEAPGGFRLAAGASGVARLVDAGSQTARAVVARLERLERDTDLVVIDCAAGIGRSVLGMLLAADMPVVVVTPEPTSYTDAYGLIKAASREAARRGETLTPQLWVNQARDRGEAERVYERISKVARRFLGAPVGMIGWTPADSAVPDAVRKRRPVVLLHPSRPVARAIRRTADEMVDRLECNSGAQAPRLGYFRRVFSSLGGVAVKKN